MTDNFTVKLNEYTEKICLGEWIIDSTGVYKENGDKGRTYASHIAVLPTALYRNMDNGMEKVELSYFKINRWRTVIVDRQIIASRTAIVKLASEGIEVTSESARNLVVYLSDVITRSLTTIPYRPSRSVLGWVEDGFVPYSGDITFDGEDSFKHLFKAVTKRGALSEWVEFMRPLRTNRVFRLVMAASFASPLIELVSENPFVLHLWGGTGTGKAQPLDTRIVTPDGYKLMGDIRVGDTVIGGDGLPHIVTGVFPQGVKPIYRVTFKDGTSTRCCKEHLWNVTTRTRRGHGRGYTVVPLEEILKRPIKDNRGYQYCVPVCKPVCYTQGANLPIDPYLLGALIGDGCLTLKKNPANGSRAIYFSNTEDDVIASVDNCLRKISCFLRRNKYTQCEYVVSGDGLSTLKEKIINLGLNCRSGERFIPPIYLFASEGDRRRLLAGLFDTDGSVSKHGAYSYSTMSKRLADDVVILCRSLGIRATSKHTNKGYHVIIFTDEIIYTSTKHAERHEAHKKTRNRREDKTAMSIVSVERCGEAPCQCIMVDSAEHTYLCDDFIVTHNTVTLMCAMSTWGDPTGGKLTRTMNMTANSMLSTAAFLNNLPFAGDELQTIKSRWDNYDNLIMCITEGIDRGRMKFDTVNETRSWRCSFLFTGEEPCIKAASGGGAKNRVIEVHLTDTLVEHGNKTVNFIRQHYGSAALPYLQELQRCDVVAMYQTAFSRIIESCDTTDKQAGAMALLLTADKIASNLFWKDEDELTVAQVKPYMFTNAEVDVAERAYSYIKDAISENAPNFQETARMIWGVIEGNAVYINKSVLAKLLNSEGFSFDAVKGAWKERGYVELNAQGNFRHRKFLGGIQLGCIKLILEPTGTEPSEPTQNEYDENAPLFPELGAPVHDEDNPFECGAESENDTVNNANTNNLKHTKLPWEDDD